MERVKQTKEKYGKRTCTDYGGADEQDNSQVGEDGDWDE